MATPPANPPVGPAAEPWTLRALNNGGNTTNQQHDNNQQRANSGSRSSSREQPHVARALPLTFGALLGLHQLSRPLMVLTALSVLPAVRARFFITWLGTKVAWARVSRVLWWSALLCWLSGQSLYVLTIAYWWRQDGTRRERDRDT